MTEHILITQCLQNDFVKPIDKYSVLPNLLHIGYNEAKRLMGEIPEEGPVAKLIEWAYQQDENELEIIHIRDWHDPEDILQKSHLKHFGEHCIKNTGGAEFIFNKNLLAKRKENKIVNALTLNDFQDTNLKTLLEEYKDKAVSIGLIGVWTEAKIFFLAYELSTRYPGFEIGVCSALTASSSVSQHFLALEQMEKLLGVRFFSSVGQFIEFLGGESSEIPLPNTSLVLKIDTDGTYLDETDEKLLRYLFRDCSKVSMKILDGGFSGNKVLGTKSTDLLGHEQVPHVVKIGNQEAIGKERASFEKIQSVLGNIAPHIADFADYGKKGAIKYRYASMGKGISTSFQKRYKEMTIDEIHTVLDTVFVEQLGRFYSAGTPEKCNLFEHYLFSSKWAESVRKKVESLVGSKVYGNKLKFWGEKEIPNLCNFYEYELDNISPKRQDACYFSYVHGDLNGANIVIDKHENVWLIDFFHTSRGHILKDLIKFENDLLYIFTDISTDEEFREALILTDLLLEVKDLAETLVSFSFKSEKIDKAYKVIQILRGFYPELIKIFRNPLQFFIGQLRYAVHTLSFDESNHYQKLWALYTSSRVSDNIIRYLKKNEVLRVDWLEEKDTFNGKLGLTMLPGRRDYDRDLNEDIQALGKEGVTHIISLITDNEYIFYGVENLLDEYKIAGFEVKCLPIIDQGVCTANEISSLINWITENLKIGAKIMIHCVGGLGRSGTVAGCYLKSSGYNSENAVKEVRRVRSPRAIETAVQEEFINKF